MHIDKEVGFFHLVSLLISSADFLYDASGKSANLFIEEGAKFHSLLDNCPTTAYDAILTVLQAEYSYGVLNLSIYQCIVLAVQIILLITYIAVVMFVTIRTLSRVSNRKNSIYDLFFRLGDASLEMLGYKRMRLEKYRLKRIKDALLEEGLDWRAGAKTDETLQLAKKKEPLFKESESADGKPKLCVTVSTDIGDVEMSAVISGSESSEESGTDIGTEIGSSRSGSSNVSLSSGDKLGDAPAIDRSLGPEDNPSSMLEESIASSDSEDETGRADLLQLHDDGSSGDARVHWWDLCRENLTIRLLVALFLPVLFVSLLSLVAFFLTASLFPVFLDLERSSEREIEGIAVRFYAREFVLNNSTSSTRAYLEEHTEKLAALHANLLYGQEKAGFPYRYEPQNKLLFSESCLRSSSSDCRDSSDPYHTETSEGMDALLLTYVSHARSLAASESYPTLNNSDYLFIWEVGGKEVYDSCSKSSRLYSDETVQIAYLSLTAQLILLVITAVVFTLSYSLMLRPLLRKVEEDVQSISGLLKLFPPRVIDSDVEVAAFMEQLIQETQNY